MKKLSKVLVLVLSAIMVLAMSASAFAQTVGTAADGKGNITITNAAKGETYAVYKLFDAKNSAKQTEGKSDSIAYTGTIPESLSAYFEKDSAGNITAKAAAKAADGSLSEAAVTALTAWAKTQTATASAKSDGSELTFAGLDYGYYVVTTTQGKTAISVDSTQPNATIVDKNSTEPKIEEGEGKTVNNTNVNIGESVTYTIKFTTANYSGEGKDAKQIYQYTIHDTLPSFLGNVTVTSIKVLEGTEETTLATQQFDNNGNIVIPWVNAEGASLYANNADLVITYTATVTDKAAVDGNGNKNEVTISYQDKDGKDLGKKLTDSETIFTYAAAIKKVDQTGAPLAGAKFELPFYVNATAAEDGAYVYAGTTAGEGLVNVLETPADGVIVIKGLKAGTAISITESEAPAGYNKLTAPVSVTPVKTESTTTDTTIILDKDGKVVETATEETISVNVKIDELAATPIVVLNKTGAELPTTGGIGTTIFYVLGSLLVVGCGIVLVSRKRMQNNK